MREQEGEAADLGTATRAAEAEAEAEAGRGDEDQAKEEGTQEGNGGGGGAGEKAGCAARWVEEGHFRSFTYWQHDTGPRESDGPNKAMQWLSLAGEVSCRRPTFHSQLLLLSSCYQCVYAVCASIQ